MKLVHNACLGDGQGDRKVMLVEQIQIPIHIAAGHLEAATEVELRELAADIQHELSRR